MANKHIEIKHKEILYPSVLVKTSKAGGSGTVVYSKPISKGSEEYETYVLTNWHVVEAAIAVKREWDPLLSKDVKKETRATVTVEFYRYKNLSCNIGRTAVEADIVAYDKDQDIALVKLRSAEPVKYVARLHPKDVKNIHIFDTVYICGCSLGHSPIPTNGEITSMDDEIDNYKYWMSNGQIIYGNSGGGVYLVKTIIVDAQKEKEEEFFEFIGIPSRIEVIGWGDSITHMGYFIPIGRIYDWLEEEMFQFIFDSKFTSTQCEKMRDKRKEEARKAFERRERKAEEDSGLDEIENKEEDENEE